ncbi:hypothetical protein BD311DRAFT_668097 [Dichomitus squalens]|uniref:DUF5648 domain-containing protein n=1 Tax=Dichomitus squalens TaxID=114155 RepID=A0A4Q9MFL9_9APHY|nr:hypothetical protein BD311DRAFT_668097 [Dichomitus squalens]
MVSASPAIRAALELATIPDCGYPTVPLLRAYFNSKTAHFYTTNATEMNAFINGAEHYISEGVAAQILPSDTQAPRPSRSFGVVGYVYPDQECGTVPLYWFYKDMDEANFDFYTTE